VLAADGVHISTSDRCGASVSGGATNKRKRSWSRAVFSNLQRKGLEKRFQLQKYITKPDRRQLAATLGLTDAQVIVCKKQHCLPVDKVFLIIDLPTLYQLHTTYLLLLVLQSVMNLVLFYWF
jgi:hypothetical protein